MVKLPSVKSSYPILLNRIKSTIESGRKQIELTKALTYWRVGGHISTNILANKQRAGHDKRVFSRLAKDLNVSERLLYDTVDVHRTFPNLPARANLGWTHYKRLLRIEDQSIRNRLLAKAAKENLTTRQLAGEIKRATIPASSLPPTVANYILTKLIASDFIKCPQGSVLIDCGFNFSSVIKRNALKGVQLVKTRAAMSFTYKAYPVKVIDGDTIWVVADLGLGNYTYQKLRLRGIIVRRLRRRRAEKQKHLWRR